MACVVQLSLVLSRVDQLDSSLEPLTREILKGSLGKRPSSESMRNALFALRSEYEILTDSRLRSELFDLLRPGEAGELCARIGLEPSLSPWEGLQEARWADGSRQLDVLCDFFGVEVPQASSEPVRACEWLEPAYALFPHQRHILEEVRSIIDDSGALGGGRAIVHMPTGAGKTRTAMALICDHMRVHAASTVVWLANSAELCEQAAEEFKKAWSHRGDRQVRLVRAWGGSDWDLPTVGEGSLVVAGVQQLAASLRRDEGRMLQSLGRQTSLVVFDEAHMAVAPTYERVVGWLTTGSPPASLVGLTATPGRTWNDPDEDRRLLDMFRRRVTMKVDGYQSPISYLMKEGYLARPDITQVPWCDDALDSQVIRSIEDGLDLPVSFVRNMASNAKRNAVVIQHLMQLASEHKRILVFAASVEHAKALAQVAAIMGLGSARCVTGQTSSYDREAAIRWYQEASDDVRILSNFGVLTTGFDAPRTSACLIARPTMSLVLYSQMIGRALRGTRAGGNAFADVRTVIDFNLPGFRNPVEMFENWEDIWTTST